MEWTVERELHAHPAHIALAKVFSSVTLLGPRMSEQLVRLVAHLFTPEEAEVVLHLPFYTPREINAIARKARRAPEEIKPLLDSASARRTIYSGPKGYSLLPIIPGMFEYMLMGGADSEWHREYARLLEEVIDTGYMKDYMSKPIPAVRNIPVESAVEGKSRVADADLVSEMIENHDDLAVLHVCQCRQITNFTGKRCKRSSPADGCLVFGSFAKAAVESGNGRSVSKAEMHNIVRERWKRNLVFLTANVSPSSPNAVCTCCDCCCHFLGAVHKYDGKALMAEPHYLVRVKEPLCNHCGGCTLACNTNAHSMIEKRHVFDPLKCIGCGLCVGRCKEGAIEMVENPRYEKPASGYHMLGLKLLGPVALSGLSAKIRRYIEMK